ncbi:MAG: WYL domain-containing protein [Lachnospiraceae bacterium]
MAEFNELIKHFNKVRTYVRDFYVYGFKSRMDYPETGRRSYDNERRRIESWFTDYIQYDYDPNRKKSVAITLDSNRIDSNPLYNVWKTKSFTNNDIMLHFFLLDLLQDGESRNVETITDELLEHYQVLFETQTVRKKLNEYGQHELIAIKKEGRQHIYSAYPDWLASHPELYTGLKEAVSYFQTAAPFGFIGSTILDSLRCRNDHFRFRHDFLAHTLEDEMLLPILTAIKEKQQLLLQIKSNKDGNLKEFECVPLKIRVSTQTGRRYVCVRRLIGGRLATYRLDNIQKVTPLKAEPDYDRYLAGFEKNSSYAWGVSFGSRREPEQVCLHLSLDEMTEGYLIDRINREGRGGQLKRIQPDIYEYTIDCWDSAEMIPWIRTFTGRILNFTCSNKQVEQRFWHDIRLMQKIYADETNETMSTGGQ